MRALDVTRFRRFGPHVYTTYGAKMSTTYGRRKIKKSFSISLESESFIRRTREERGAGSESEALDLLLSEMMAVEERRKIEAAYTDYYDSITNEELAEEAAWGSFTETQLAEGVR